MNEVERGYLSLYRQFDVADGIDLDDAARRVARGETRRLDLPRTKAKVSLSAPPLSFTLGQRQLQIDGVDYFFNCSAKAFDFGVVSVILRIEVPHGYTLEQLVPLNARLSENHAIDRLAKDLALSAFDDLKASMHKPKLSGFVEDYTIIYIEAFVSPPKISLLAADPSLPRLMLAEASERGIADEALEDAVQMRFSYFADELTIIDWNSAFVYDPTGDTDVPDLIEFASAQLLELRYYDDLVDRHLASMYDEVEQVRGSSLNKRQVKQLTRRMLQVVLETTELTEKIDNSLKWVGDLYLARFYQGAAKQFALSRWQAQIERKLNLMSNATELLSDQINTDRALFLETSIVALILVELALAAVNFLIR